MNVYDLQEVIRISVLFTRVDNGLPVDPTTVKLYLMMPDLTTQVLTAPDVVHIGLGSYQYEVELLQAGVWSYRWQADGAVTTSTSDIIFAVNCSAFALA